ncbi:DUF977 family protein [Enterobacter hormaechei]|uniref:DUF977 family protein n=1 Tax=Enterobacter hormaechei TaxID=158836 RepID=UPI0005DC203C|nr:DUF977 family protein [Enterobacter hormaechei]MCM7179393.1 DUF977 family protein [Enterobacter hormaechei]WDT15761.1 hypothetical protein LNGFDJGK_01629 [Enterobacter hormaechei]CQR76786.1 hypothetical protein BN1385_01641 [Enterobacter hormaechei]VAC88273.1 Bacterial protein of uncharacterised function (DUF977) [Enterobacter hormaechei]
MARKKTDKERALIINRIIELVKEQGRITKNDVVAMFGLHRTTAEKYLRVAVDKGGLVRYGICGIFRYQRTVIEFNLERYTNQGVSTFEGYLLKSKGTTCAGSGACYNRADEHEKLKDNEAQE